MREVVDPIVLYASVVMVVMVIALVVTKVVGSGTGLMV